jgi:hypothetical protein
MCICEGRVIGDMAVFTATEAQLCRVRFFPGESYSTAGFLSANALGEENREGRILRLWGVLTATVTLILTALSIAGWVPDAKYATGT